MKFSPLISDSGFLISQTLQRRLAK